MKNQTTRVERKEWKVAIACYLVFLMLNNVLPSTHLFEFMKGIMAGCFMLGVTMVMLNEEQYEKVKSIKTKLFHK